MNTKISINNSYIQFMIDYMEPLTISSTMIMVKRSDLLLLNLFVIQELQRSVNHRDRYLIHNYEL